MWIIIYLDEKKKRRYKRYDTYETALASLWFYYKNYELIHFGKRGSNYA